MMKINEVGDELIIRETPGLMWILSLVFVLPGATFIYGALGGFVDYKDHSPLIINLSLIFGIVALGIGIWLLINAPITKVTINRAARTVTLLRRGFYGAKQTVYRFDEVETFSLIEEFDSEGDKVWSTGLILASGETIKLNSQESHSAESESKGITQANLFINK